MQKCRRVGARSVEWAARASHVHGSGGRLGPHGSGTAPVRAGTTHTPRRLDVPFSRKLYDSLLERKVSVLYSMVTVSIGRG